MGLFQHSVLNKYLKETNQAEIKTAFEKLKAYFHNPVIQQNIRESKEEQFQEGYLTELFVKVFGYTINPNPDYNLTTEYKNERGAKKADGAILKDGTAVGVIELKSTTTKDLESIRMQAFDYKANQSKCVYVITSNFEKVRFYIQNAVEFEEFDLFRLTWEHFQLMWLCLAKENLLRGIPLQMKEASIIKEEDVTKKIYVDYSLFKRDLNNDLVENNLTAEIFKDKTEKEIKLLLFKKSQKLLDRFLFILFSEDRGLLPPNSISEIIKQWENQSDWGDDVKLYDRYKKYFHLLNTGWKGKQHEIFAYNGGLFAPDEILEAVNISDGVLNKHTKILTTYDFESEVDVNILGHIFENSLNEIEEVTAQIEGEAVDRKKSKRKKDGVFYTPKYITRYIVENTVGKLCEEKRTEINLDENEYLKSRKGRTAKKLKELDGKLDEYREWLLSLTVCDPACGSGAFLNQALDFLIREHRYIDELRAKLLDVPMIFTSVENSILEKNIYGVDINEESVEIAKLSLWLRTAQKGRKLTTLSNNIKCGNSLIDDPEVAGEKAFNWYQEFPEIFRKKKKEIWHVTTATHNSRYSQKMFDNHVTTDEAVWLSEKEEIIVAETIARIAHDDKLNILACNICGDHMHMLLVCTEVELPKIVQKIKSISARECNIAMGRTIPGSAVQASQAAEHAPLPAAETTEHAPSLVAHSVTPNVETAEHAPLQRGKTQFHLWTKKFGKTRITSTVQFDNTLSYIKNNRIKHQLPENKALHQLFNSMTCSREYAFRTEYTGGFDVVIGNPPYVDIKALDNNIVNYLFRKFRSANNRVNLYSSFIERSIELLDHSKYFSFIIPSSLLTQESYKELRKILLNETALTNIVRLPNESFGGSAGEVKVDTIILSYRKDVDLSLLTEIFIYKGFNRISEITAYNADIYFLINPFNWKKDESFIFRLNNDITTLEILNKCEVKTKKLIDCADFCLGLTPYDKYKGHTQEQIKGRVFHAASQIDDTYKKLLAGNDIKRYHIEWGGAEWISYGQWLGAPREPRFFKNKRILVKQIIDWTDKRIWAAITDEELYNTQNAFTLLAKNGYIPEYLVALINSKLISFYHRKKYLEEFKDRFQKILIKDAKDFPIKQIHETNQEQFIDAIKKVMSSTNKLRIEISAFDELIQSKFDLNKLSVKLQKWYELGFNDFLKELKKAKVKLTLSEEAEWMTYFNEQKQKALALKSEIDQTDREIDQMVYELYGMTDEEIGIVEGTI